jgi:hypothetical protein
MAANQTPPIPPDPIFEVAFKKLKDSVTEADAKVFQSTTFEDVWKAAEDIERIHREKRSLKNMRRIEPFLKGLEGYSKVIEVICNGTPYMPWIWVFYSFSSLPLQANLYQAPIKLMLQVRRAPSSYLASYLSRNSLRTSTCTFSINCLMRTIKSQKFCHNSVDYRKRLAMIITLSLYLVWFMLIY